MRVFNETLATAVPLNADYASPFVPLKSIFMYSVTFIVAGTPTGTVVIQASNDPETNDTQPSTNRPTHWATIANSQFTLTTAGNSMWNVHDVAYNYVRLLYTDASGGTSTATASIVVNGKGA